MTRGSRKPVAPSFPSLRIVQYCKSLYNTVHQCTPLGVPRGAWACSTLPLQKRKRNQRVACLCCKTSRRGASRQA